MVRKRKVAIDQYGRRYQKGRHPFGGGQEPMSSDAGQAKDHVGL